MLKITNLEETFSKRVTYIVATKDRADHLDKMLFDHKELFSQLDELIIVDGNSSDHTQKVVEKYRDFIGAVIIEDDFGATHALNKAVLISRGKYIRPLSDDDHTFKEGMERAVEVMEKSPEVDVLVCGGTRQYGERSFPIYVPPGAGSGKSVSDVIRYGSSGVGHLVRKRALALIGSLYPTTIASDNEFVLRAISYGANVKFCRIDLFNHPIHSQTINVRYAKQIQADINRLIRQYYPWWSYFWYRGILFIKNVFARFPWIKTIFNPLFYLIGKFIKDDRAYLVPQRDRKKALFEDKGFVWDGGFS